MHVIDNEAITIEKWMWKTEYINNHVTLIVIDIAYIYWVAGINANNDAK